MMFFPHVYTGFVGWKLNINQTEEFKQLLWQKHGTDILSNNVSQSVSVWLDAVLKRKAEELNIENYPEKAH